tara:strand:- start:12464 stop:13816 length:1353 start_codon:yes stop_codon:yes gene_type:complete
MRLITYTSFSRAVRRGYNSTKHFFLDDGEKIYDVTSLFKSENLVSVLEGRRLDWHNQSLDWLNREETELERLTREGPGLQDYQEIDLREERYATLFNLGKGIIESQSNLGTLKELLVGEINTLTLDKSQGLDSEEDNLNFDDPTKERVMGIVRKYVTRENPIKHFETKLGLREERDILGIDYLNRANTIVNGLEDREAYLGSALMVLQIYKDVEDVADDALKKDLLQIVFNHGVQKKEYKYALYAAKELGHSDSAIHKVKLNAASYGLKNYGSIHFPLNFINKIQELCADLSVKEKKKIGNSAYNYALKHSAPNSNRYELNAFILAKELDLGKKKQRRAIRRFKHHGNFNNELREIEQYLIEQEDFKEELEPFFWKIFRSNIGNYSDDDKKINRVYNFPEDSFKDKVNEEYKEALERGSFKIVDKMQKDYGHLLEDKIISDEELELMLQV